MVAAQTGQAAAEKSVRSLFVTTFHPKKEHHALTHLVRFTPLTVSSSFVPTVANGYSATQLLTAQAEQVTSDKSLCSHSTASSHRQKPHLVLTHLVLPTPLTISCSVVPTAAEGYFPIYLLTAQTDQVTSDQSVRLHLVMLSSIAKKQYAYLLFSLRLTELSFLRLTTHKLDEIPQK